MYSVVTMESGTESHGIVLPHHEQQPLCTTRLPYRQGRNLTAVKVYTINNESNHLLIFGVPSLNLRQEAKALFSKFGKLVRFIVSMEHPAEVFTETYHAVFERIQSARVAKRMLDTKTFYGGSLHICYAPELETIDEARSKLLQRQRDVIYRLKNLQKESVTPEKNTKNVIEEVVVEKNKLNMGEVNFIGPTYSGSIKKRKRDENVVIEKKFKPCFVSDTETAKTHMQETRNVSNIKETDIKNRNIKKNDTIEVIDITSTQHETVTNINDCLNYDKFGNEDVRKVPPKPLNKIQFFVGNKR